MTLEVFTIIIKEREKQMNKKTHIATALDAIVPDRIRYDEYVKEVLADVQILARILKYSVEELKELSIDEIILCIDEEQIEIGKAPVAPGLTNFGKIKGAVTEDTVINEGTVYFDIRFPVYYSGRTIKILINIEAQKSTKSKNKLISMLEDLLSKEDHVTKKQKLIEKHGIKMTVELERRIGDMCNLSDIVIEDAIKEGLEKGMKEGMKEGMEKGKIVLVKTLKELDKSKEFIVEKLMENFSLTETEAKKYL